MHFPFVDRLHVGASEAAVEEALRRALKPGVAEKDVKKLLKIALKQHRENREMYGFVMGGMHRSRRKNPELLIVRNPGRRKMAYRRRKLTAARRTVRLARKRHMRRVRRAWRRLKPTTTWKMLVKLHGVKEAAKIWRRHKYVMRSASR